MTEAAELVESIIVVPAKGDVTANFSLEPTGADQLWILKDANATEVDTIRVQFAGVKDGGTEQSGKVTLMITLTNTDLVFAKLSGNIDGMKTYDDQNDGLGAIQSCQVKDKQPQVLEIDLKANKQSSNGFSFKWVAEDVDGNQVESADPDARFDPL
ncbi:hypothetical protein PVT68_15270 [Microbulbifer bruguierae]|uniref:PLAT domain-containing protein n=1 Tax=Microbulbifer bruguierae TaxID=3029061 RepID=A0ABY8NC04_9GAMM|nr:hypothetical protein [Microbulbifer bruguierae]WGL16122.1 hypothetical protein PVT68_15270 [Microbulbifer bruguierae]